MRPLAGFPHMLMALGLVLAASVVPQARATAAVEVATPASTATPALVAGGGQVTPSMKYCPPDDDLCDPFPRGRPPVISWSVAPNNGQYFLPTDTITLVASASDPDGSIVNVTFDVDSQGGITATRAPYQTTLSGLAAGLHTVRAIATDNQAQRTATNTVTFNVRNSVVKGYLDGVSSAGLVTGWACSSYLNQSIRVHLYLGGPYGAGTYVGSYVANQASEAAVDSACGVSSGSFRYRIALTDAQRIHYGDKSIYVYGISPVGGSNNLLTHSGNSTVPVFIRDAQYVSQSVDASMVTGHTQTVSVKMRNNGDYTWTAGSNFRLGSQSTDNAAWGVSRAYLSSSVGPGQTATFTFTIKAPSTPGSYNFRWRMLQESVVWFGDLTPNVAITVSAPPPVVSFSSSIEYDELGRVLARHDSSGAVVASYVYDAEGHVTAVTDALKHVSTREYDALGRLAKSTNALNGVTRYAYDVADHLTQVTDPRNLMTRYTYDGFGQLWAQTSPDTGTSRQTFNASGQLATSSRNDGSVVAYGYDTLGRLTQKSAGQEVQHFSYDTCAAGIGRLCAVSDAMSTESFSYDPAGHLLQQKLVGPNGRNMTTSYAYDGKGRLASLTYPDGAATHYTYAAGKLSRLQLTAGGVTTDLIKNIGYDVTGQPSYWTYGNDTYRMQSFDANGRLSGLRTMAGSGSLQNYKYVYDLTNRMTQRVNLGVPAKSASYAYDALGRLNSETTNEAGTRLDYSYDANGNRLSVNWAGVGATQDLIAANSNQLQSDGANSYSYNANGNRESWHVGDSTAIYAYDGFGRMLGTSRDVAYGNWTATYPAGITSYAVNPLGQRVYKNGPSGEFWFDYSPGGQLLSDYITGLGATDYVYFGGQPIALVRGGSIAYLHDDHLGRPELATNAGGAVVWSASNSSFGRNSEQGSLAQMNLGFPGQYYDAETGHWYNMHRDYDQQTGRYLESDPIGLRGGVNTYAYVMGNPISNIDPLGLRPLTACEKNALKPYISQQDLDNADLHDGEVPSYLGKDYDGITRGNDIYFRPGVYDPSTSAGIALLGHELVHVGQYRQGMTWITYLWSTRHGYGKSKYEKPAYAMQSRIQDDLNNNGTAGCGCTQ